MGFSLVETMGLLVIIALLAAIAIPNTLRARQTAEETKTQKELQGIHTAIIMFEISNMRKPTSWDELRDYIMVDEAKYILNPNTGT